MSGQLFHIAEIDHQDGQVSALLRLNPDHAILKGHFPGQPVVPGACLVQVVKEVMEKALNTPLLLTNAGMIKFISMLVPQIHPTCHLTVTYKPDEEPITFTAQIKANDAVCFKMQGKFSKS